jgi:type II secretory ATPase GspE/PulE/Tfp pilus assembly ATPase PilB-like protein
VRGRGCSACHRTGFRGRIAVRELLEIDDTMRALISRGANVDELRAHAVASGFRSMRLAALRLLVTHQTSAREVLRVTKAG